MNTDCAYVIGSSHQVCQDYARVGDGYALLSDGCSSSPDTDIGARLLVVTAETLMRDANGDAWEQALAMNTAQQARELHLPPSCLDATLLVARVVGETVCVTIIGDGAVVWETHGGVQETLICSFSENRPLYASYLANDERKAQWEATQPQMQICRRREGRCDESTVTDWEMLNPLLTIPRQDCRFVALFSDGVGSFTERTATGETRAVPIGEVVRELVKFKSFKGAFAQRRMNAFLKQCAARGWKHHDDLSMAVIALGDE